MIDNEERIGADYETTVSYVVQNHITKEDYKEYPIKIVREVMIAHERKFGVKSILSSTKRTLDKILLNRPICIDRNVIENIMDYMIRTETQNELEFGNYYGKETLISQHMLPEEYYILQRALGEE